MATRSSKPNGALTLADALKAAAPALRVSSLYSDPLIELTRHTLRAYNGQLLACVNITDVASAHDLPEDDPVVVSGDKLVKVWSDSGPCRLSAAGKIVTVARGGTRYRLPRLERTLFGAPAEVPLAAPQALTADQADAILRAARYTDENAAHPWARGVILHDGRAFGTTGKIVVSIATGIEAEGTLPPWALAAMRKGEALRLSMDAKWIGLAAENGKAVTFALAYADKAPLDVLGKPLATIPPPETLRRVPARALREAVAAVTVLGGKRVELTGNAVTARLDDGGEAVSELDDLDIPEETVLGADIARLVFEYADWVSFDQVHAPGRLIFGGNDPNLLGICMTMRRP